MKIFIVDAFAQKPFCGNQAGVALLAGEEPFPTDELMQKLAAELKHSETAFVRRRGPGRFQVRYFTPQGEVDLCGHATVAAFTVLREEGICPPGRHTASTKAGELDIRVETGAVWMNMAPPEERRTFTGEESVELYAAYGLGPEDRTPDLEPRAVSAGLCDIMLPVNTPEALNRAEQNEAEVVRLSRRYGVVGVHMFCPGAEPGVTARCRNFAPLYAIAEEAATGTSNGALTYYLYRRGLLSAGGENLFLQGERMGKPSEIRTRLLEEKEGVKVLVGGPAVVVLRCEPAWGAAGP